MQVSFLDFKLNFSLYFVLLVILGTSITLCSEFDRIAFSISPTVSNPVVLWNELGSNITLSQKFYPPEIARILAFLDIAMYDALLTANSKSNNFSETALVTGAASTVLDGLFPNKSKQILELKNELMENQSTEYDKDMLEWSESLGVTIAKNIIDSQKSHLPIRDAINDTYIPRGDCVWNGTDPVLPHAGTWDTILLNSESPIISPDPFLCGSKEDLMDVEEVYELSKQRTPYQISAIHYWGDKPPSIIWNNILIDLIKKYDMSVFQSAYAAAYLNSGMHDAFVSCWNTKYEYWTSRPDQRLPDLITEIPTPNFPSFTSGHSVVSTTASIILSQIIPEEEKNLKDLANEASLSRLWAGIHFRHDIISGIDQGSQIGNIVIDDMKLPPHRFFGNDSSYSHSL